MIKTTSIVAAILFAASLNACTAIARNTGADTAARHADCVKARHTYISRHRLERCMQAGSARSQTSVASRTDARPGPRSETPTHN